MSGTGIASGSAWAYARAMRCPAEGPSTDLLIAAAEVSAYTRAMRCPVLTYRRRIGSYIGRRVCYALSGTDIAHCAVPA
eukprot:3941979-Rhodomonas_salina.6